MTLSEKLHGSGRSSHEERGLKFAEHPRTVAREWRRSSHEERGLKCGQAGRLICGFLSLLA